VLYLEPIDIFKQKFQLVIKQNKAFNQALWKANQPRECTIKHFGDAEELGFAAQLMQNVEQSKKRKVTASKCL
jgi:hypothetical protein